MYYCTSYVASWLRKMLEEWMDLCVFSVFCFRYCQTCLSLLHGYQVATHEEKVSQSNNKTFTHFEVDEGVS